MLFPLVIHGAEGLGGREVGIRLGGLSKVLVCVTLWMSCPPTSPGGLNSGEGGTDEQGYRPEAPTRTSHLGRSLISPLPTANNAYLGQGEGRRAGQIQIRGDSETQVCSGESWAERPGRRVPWWSQGKGGAGKLDRKSTGVSLVPAGDKGASRGLTLGLGALKIQKGIASAGSESI